MIVKKLLTLICSSVVLISACGCVGNNQPKLVLSEDNIIGNMQSKYNTSFTYKGNEHDMGGGAFGTTQRLIVVLENSQYPNKDIHAQAVIQTDESGNKVVNYFDNFLAVKYSDQARQLLQDIGVSTFGECKLMFKISENPVSGLGADASFEDYISARFNGIVANYSIPPGHDTSDVTLDDEMQKIVSAFQSNGIALRVNIMYMRNQTVYDEYNELYDDQNKKFDATYGFQKWKVAGTVVETDSSGNIVKAEHVRYGEPEE